MKLLGAIALFLPFASAIWPIPSSYTSGDTVLWVDKKVKITYNGETQSVGYIQNSSNPNGTVTGAQIVATAIQRTLDTIFTQNFIPWKFHPRNSNFEPSGSNKTYISSIALQQNSTDSKTVSKALDGAVDESYTLSVTKDGAVTITAASSIGISYGLNTFTQLFYKHSKGGVYTPLAPVQISDAPKFPHRGMNMDVARSWYPVPDVLRMIDALAYNKMNRFHLHATDSQSWPLVIPALPDLAAKGAYRSDLVYSPADLKKIQTYGPSRGVEVIVEIDMPGHTSSIWFSHPELIAAFNVQPNWGTYAAEPPSGTLKLNSSAVYDFLNTLLNDLLPRVSPYSSYFHTGGDEVNLNAYNLDETVGSNKTAVLQPLMQKFVDRNHNQVRAAGLTPIVWEEMLLVWNLTPGEDVVVQTWQSDAAVAATVASGHKALVGNYNYWLVAVLLAGRDTTACTLSWLFFELSRNARVVRALRREVLDVVGLGRAPTYAHLKSMRYLQHTLNETLRLYPVVPFNVRVALRDTSLPHGGGADGLQPIGVLAGSPVGYSTLVMQRRGDGEIYPDPRATSFPPILDFVPERWAAWTPKPWTYLPFNGGPRICVGQQFALTEMAYTVVRILQRFERVDGGGQGEPGLKAEIVLQPARGVKARFWREGESE